MRREYPEAPIVGVGAVVIDGGRVLLVRRGNPPLQGEWSLPGGALELGEALEEGAVREVFEECGLAVETAGLVEVLDRISKDETGHRILYHYVLVDFLCRVVGGKLAAASDAADARWVERKQLNSHGAYRLAPVTVVVIEKAFRMAAADHSRRAIEALLIRLNFQSEIATDARSAMGTVILEPRRRLRPSWSKRNRSVWKDRR